MQVIKSTSNNQNSSINNTGQQLLVDAQYLFATGITIEELEPRLELKSKGPDYGAIVDHNHGSDYFKK